MTLRDLPGYLLREESRFGASARELWRWLTPGRARNRIAIVLAAFAAERTDVFFIQVGAHEGNRGDPLRRHVLAHDWSGILVEPVPYVFERLRANYGARRNLILENAAIGPTDGRMPFYHLRQTTEALPHWYDQLGSFLRSNIAKHARYIPNIEQRVVETPVECITFESLCRKHGVDRIDLLQIDAEGFDFEIVKLVDFARRAPDLVLYEHRHLSARDHAACRALLETNGYDYMEDNADALCMRRGAPGARLARVWHLMQRAGARRGSRGVSGSRRRRVPWGSARAALDAARTGPVVGTAERASVRDTVEAPTKAEVPDVGSRSEGGDRPGGRGAVEGGA